MDASSLKDGITYKAVKPLILDSPAESSPLAVLEMEFAASVIAIIQLARGISEICGQYINIVKVKGKKSFNSGDKSTVCTKFCNSFTAFWRIQIRSTISRTPENGSMKSLNAVLHWKI